MSAANWKPGRLLQREMAKNSELRASVAKIAAEKGDGAQLAVDQMEAALQERFEKEVAETVNCLKGRNRDNNDTMRREFVAADGRVIQSIAMEALYARDLHLSSALKGAWVDVSSKWGTYA